MMNLDVFLDILGISFITASFLINICGEINKISYIALFIYALCCSLRILMDDLS